MVGDPADSADGGRPASEPFLAGDRVSLRALERDEIGFVHDATNDPRVRPALGLWYPSTREQEEAWFDEASGRDDVLAFVVEVDGERAGVVEADPIDWQAGTVEVSFWLHPDSRGAGHAREALSLLVGYAFDELRAHKVTANAYAGNERSRHLLDAVGFVEEGVGARTRSSAVRTRTPTTTVCSNASGANERGRGSPTAERVGSLASAGCDGYSSPPRSAVSFRPRPLPGRPRPPLGVRSALRGRRSRARGASGRRPPRSSDQGRRIGLLSS